jgi:hypothetical protein
MLLLISDASVLIDIECAELTSAMFSLPYKFAVPDILFVEELAERHGHLSQFGLISKPMSSELISEAYDLRQRYSKPSVNDLLALTLAKNENSQLLTGDKALREVAQILNVEVHGTIWLVTQMIQHKKITVPEEELEYEKKYFSGYAKDDKATIAIAKVENQIVGIATGIPLISESDIVTDAQKVFSKQGIQLDDYYYCGEIIVLPQFRSLSLITKLSQAGSTLLKKWGFKHICMLTVIREENHPLKPKNYKSPDNLWAHLGFVRNHLTIGYHWPTIQPDNTVVDTKNSLEFWTKNLW